MRAMVQLPEPEPAESVETNQSENNVEPTESEAAGYSEKVDEAEPKTSKDDVKEDEVVSDQNEASSAEASVSTSSTGTRSSASSSISSNNSSRPSSRGSEKNESVTLPQHQYDKEELIKISKSDLAKKWPDFLDPTFLNNSTGVWDPEKWFKTKRGNDTASDDLRSKRERPAEFERDLSFKRRTPDPKERIKEERDDIVLSPQRRSFGTGCHVSQQTFPVTTTRRPGSPNDSREPDNLHRDTRRIGSGRIVSRDNRDKDHRDYGYGGGRNNRFDRDERDKEPPSRYMGRYRNDRRMSRGRDDRIEEEEEPEWFSGGPTSQHETIELVGFDNPCNHDQKSGRVRRGKEIGRKPQLPLRLTESNIKSQMRESEPPPQVKETRQPEHSIPEEHVTPPLRPNAEEQDDSKKQDFDLNDIFKMDWIPGLLPNGTPPEVADSSFTGSRFSQWFRNESPTKEMLESEENSRRSSIQDELRAQVLGIGAGNRGPSPPNQSSNYFIPINPSQGHAHFNHDYHGSKDGKNILEILQNANINVTPLMNSENHTHSLKDEALSGKVKSVVELEADLKQLVLGNRPNEDKLAFNKLLSQLSDQGATMAAPPQSMSMGPVDKLKVLQEEDLVTQNYPMRILRQSTPPPMPAPTSKPQPIIQMPDLRVSPTPTLPMYGIGKDMLIDLFKDLDKQPNNQNLGAVKEQESNAVADMMRALYEQGNQNEMMNRMISQQQQHLLQNQQNAQHNRLFQVTSPAPDRSLHSVNQAFQNKPKPNDLMATQQQRPKFMSTLVPAPYGHILSTSPTPDPMGQTLNVPLAVGPHLSPRQSPLSHDLGAAVPGRIPSPLVFGQAPPLLSHAPAPIHPSQVGLSQANTLQVQNQNALPRVPSPQELAAHTQTILQNALIKRKLEEQKENYRKRQEAQRSRSPNVTTPGSAKSTTASTPPSVASSTSPSKFTSAMAAFTPTSVMRKMHSEKLDKENRSDAASPSGKVPGSPEHKVQNNATHPNPQQNGIHNSIMNHNEVQQPENSPQRIITGGNGNNNTPRALYGQGIYGQQQTQASTTPHRSQTGYAAQGRPIVKGGTNDLSDPNRGVNNAPQPKAMGSAQHKAYILPNQAAGNVLRPELDPFVARLVEQRMIGQQALQRQLNASASNKPAPTIPFFPRGTPMVTPHQNVLRPPVVNSTNENMGWHCRGGIFVPPPTAHRNQAPNLSQILAYQQQQQKCAQNMKATHPPQQQQDQRGIMDPRTLSNIHPLALQQVFFNVQSQVAQGQGMLQLNNNIGMSGRPDGNFGGPNMKNQQLMMPPGQQGGNRHSPVNLARWFGNDVLKQKMPDMPPVPLQNALSVEELERQQHTTIVHN